MISFGPVPSRRLGRSLGINNIVRPKVCSYSCIYCQVGKTKRLDITRQSFFDPELIVHEVSSHLGKLNSQEMPDYLTFVSNGEPTLDRNLGRSIRMIKRFGIPVAVITNASLLWQEGVRDELMDADWVSLKIDAATDELWRTISRPSPDLVYDTILDGIFRFSGEYHNRLNTETMLCGGVNDNDSNLSGVADIIKKTGAGKSYISIPVRPPAEADVLPPEADRVNMAWQFFTEAGIDAELLTGFEGTDTGYTGNSYEDILNITSVHPLRDDAIQELLDKNGTGFSVVESLLAQNLIRCSDYRGRKFYLRNFQVG
ncbi:MAG: radical SAM protein [Bacteroidales bacterium]|nr:radical SAM protein [Bacteroidales bacterium]